MSIIGRVIFRIYIYYIGKVGNVGKVDLRFGTIQFFLQFGLFNGVVAKINALIIVKIHQKSS